jgi:hypothetical protein
MGNNIISAQFNFGAEELAYIARPYIHSIMIRLGPPPREPPTPSTRTRNSRPAYRWICLRKASEEARRDCLAKVFPEASRLKSILRCADGATAPSATCLQPYLGAGANATAACVAQGKDITTCAISSDAKPRDVARAITCARAGVYALGVFKFVAPSLGAEASKVVPCLDKADNVEKAARFPELLA